MKKYIIMMLIISLISISGCESRDGGQSNDDDILNIESDNNSDFEDTGENIPHLVTTAKNYGYLHDIAKRYEYSNYGIGMNSYAFEYFILDILLDLDKYDEFMKDEDSIAIPEEITNQLCEFFIEEPIIIKDSWSMSVDGGERPEDPVELKPLTITEDEDSGDVTIMYGRYILDANGDKLALYPVEYTFSPHIVQESDIIDVLDDIYKAGDKIFKIKNVNNIIEIDKVGEIYSSDGYDHFSQEKSYKLSTPEDILEMSDRVNTGVYNEVNAIYTLENDIDMSGVEGFEPIGLQKYPLYDDDARLPYLSGFSGTFNGNGHSISNLLYSKDGTNAKEGFSVGFFSTLSSSAQVMDLNLENANISHVGKNKLGLSVGILSGRSSGATIINCSTSGSVTGGGGSVGGLVGYASNGMRVSEQHGIIDNCHSDVNVTGSSDIGGLVGAKNSANISNSSSKGTVTSRYDGDDVTPTNIGGFVGYNMGSEITNSFSSVEVKTMDEARCVGSFIGHNYGNVYYSFYNQDLSHWKPMGYIHDKEYSQEVTPLSSDEYKKMMDETLQGRG